MDGGESHTISTSKQPKNVGGRGPGASETRSMYNVPFWYVEFSMNLVSLWLF